MPNNFTQAFIPELWNESIERTLKPSLVYADDCTKEFEGKIRKLGDTVHILGIEKPTINEYTLSSSGSIRTDGDLSTSGTRNYVNNPDLSTPEQIAGTDQILLIDTVDYFNFELNDIDRVQSINGVMDAATKEAALGLAGKIDTNLATLIAAGVTVSGSRVDNVVDKTGSTAVGKTNILDYLDEAIQKLYESNVSPSTEIVATVSPRFFMILKQAYTNLDTNNSDMLKNGRVGRYGNVIIKMSNNVKKSDTGTGQNVITNNADTISIRTRRAVAFAQQLTGTETLRSQKHFANIVRGKVLYGAKIIRPKELANLVVKYS